MKEKICGVYKIINKLNGKCYVGQSKDIYRRWSEHKSNWLRNHQKSKALYRAFNKYGIENFAFEIIQKCKPDVLDEREEYWIKKLNSYNNGYNMTKGGHSHKTWLKYVRKHLRDYRRWQQDCFSISSSTISSTFQQMKSALLPNPDDELDALKYIDDKFVEELDGYDTMIHDFCDGYDNFEQWAECNLI